jgi:hypothetical protein
LGHTAGTPGKIVVAENFAYVPDDTSGLRIIDVSNASSPTIVATVPCSTPNESFTGVCIRSPYAYVSSGLSGVKIYHMTDPKTLALIGSYAKPNSYLQARAIAVAGNYAYLPSSADNGALYIVSVVDPAKPSLVAEFQSGKIFTDVFVVGDIAYATGDGFGVIALDVSDPSRPRALAIALPQPANLHFRLVLSGRHIYAASGGLVAYSIVLRP